MYYLTAMSSTETSTTSTEEKCLQMQYMEENTTNWNDHF